MGGRLIMFLSFLQPIWKHPAGRDLPVQEYQL
jgi:hypothetical protein